MLNDMITEEGQELLGWRTVSVDGSMLGEKAKISQPAIRQVFVKNQAEKWMSRTLNASCI